MPSQRQTQSTINRMRVKSLGGLLWRSSMVLFMSFVLLSGQPLIASAQSGDLHDELMSRVKQFREAHQWRYALSLLESRVTENPQDIDATRQLIELYQLTDQMPKARSVMQSSPVLKQGGLNALTLMAQYAIGPLVAMGSPTTEKDRLPIIDKMLADARRIAPAHAITYTLEAWQYRLQNNGPKAEEYFLRALYQDPHYVPAQQAMAEAYLDAHQPLLAGKLLSEAVDESPEDVTNLYLIGRTYLERQNPAKALEFLQRSEKADGTPRPRRLYAIAEAQRLLGQSTQAAQTYREVLDFWPDRSDIWVKSAELSQAAGDEESALKAFRAAYLINPMSIDPLITSAQKAFFASDLPAATRRYQQILSIAPERMDLVHQLALMASRLTQDKTPMSAGDIEKLYARVTAARRRSESYTLQLANVQLVDAANPTQTQNPERLKTLEKIALKSPDLLMRIEANLMRGEPVMAAEGLKALISTPDNTRALMRLVLHKAWPGVMKLIGSNPELKTYQNALLEQEYRDEQAAETILVKARTALGKSDYAGCLKILTELNTVLPVSLEGLYLRARIKAAQGQTEAARELLTLIESFDVPAKIAPSIAALKTSLDKKPSRKRRS